MNVFIGFTYPHHGKYSGYDQIRNFLPYRKSVREEKLVLLWMMRLFKPVLKRIVNYEKRYYQVFTLIAKCRCLFLRNSVIHFIYPESFIFSKKYLHSSNKIAATFHLPPDEYEKLNIRLRQKHSKIDLAIVMSLELKDYFNKILGENKVVYLPHGINTDFFKPSISVEKLNRIVVVGNWLRDFELAAHVFEKLHQLRNDLEFIVISYQDNSKYFSGMEYVKFLSGINDQQLLEYYQSAKVLFLPLKSFTANNAVLEAGACGCDILIATSLPEESYFNSNQINMTGTDTELITTRLLEMTDGYDLVKQQSLISFIHENYSWQVIAAKTMEAFRKIN